MPSSARTPAGRFASLRPHLAALVPLLPLVIVFVAADLLWATGVNLLEGARGAASHAPAVDLAGGAEDALWHLGSAFILALPTRDRRVLVLAPVLSLGLDVDHVFGLVLPATVGRSAHSLPFLLLLGAVLCMWKGRGAGLLASGAFLTHLAVDGGSFPLLDPFSLARWSFPLAVSVPLLLLCALFFLVSSPRAQRLRRPQGWVEPLLVTVVVTVAFLLFLAAPWARFLAH